MLNSSIEPSLDGLRLRKTKRETTIIMTMSTTAARTPMMGAIFVLAFVGRLVPELLAEILDLVGDGNVPFSMKIEARTSGVLVPLPL
jgi:hypothetical protein